MPRGKGGAATVKAEQNVASLRVGLRSHEKQLLSQGLLLDVSHQSSGSYWLEAPHKLCRTSAMEADRGNKCLAEDTCTSMTESSQDNLVQPRPDEQVFVFRHMTDRECDVLRTTGQLPSTQPYQTIVQGEQGYQYCKKYFLGHKKVAPPVTTIVEFAAEKQLIDELFAKQCKVEDGCISHGLGCKGGNGLPKFNQALLQGKISWKIVLVKARRKM